MVKPEPGEENCRSSAPLIVSISESYYFLCQRISCAN